ncbi:MAG: hypothetical protein KJ674_00950 [Nanoarchaeota archaeon]|nr:hypothetical protein [Nanoarchaeota archaeon]
MTIEFLLDDFQEKDKEKIKKIIQTLQKPKIIDKNTLFLKKFTLSLLGQHNKSQKLFKTREIQDLNLKINATIPKQVPQRVLNPPLRLKIDDFMPLAPKPFHLMGIIPSPHLRTVSMNIPTKKQLPQPKIIPKSPTPNKIKIPKSPTPQKTTPAPMPEQTPKPNEAPSPI